MKEGDQFGHSDMNRLLNKTMGRSVPEIFRDRFFEHFHGSDR